MEIRQPYATLGIASRSLKARKIVLLLALDKVGSNIRLLEVGCGLGWVCGYLGYILPEDSRFMAFI